MEYTTLGNTGEIVSRIGYGGAAAGLKNYLHTFDPSNPNDRRKIIESIETALDSGINYYDTAPGYGSGESEELLGSALDGVKTSGAHPLFVATKAGYNERGRLRESVELSLKRLRRDRIELLQIHGNSYTPAQADDILRNRGHGR
ncbi:aldo/keto reductase [Paenibacillus sp. TAB 01]|uniref:aldo/keto reductase n=1 Tax=Paenibacillus sp. TAB 01 TaxID=3368988 RepID=UPI003750761B